VTRPVEVFPHAEELAQRAVVLVEESIDGALAGREVARIAVSGGSTPKRTYQLLGERGSLRRDGVEVFFVDERCVSPDDHASNFKLFVDAAGDPGNVFRMRGEIDPDAAAEEYEALLRERFGDGPPAFDLLLLGVGVDGHTASLFPGEPELDERRRWVVATRRPHGWVRRITLTIPVLNAARAAVVLVTGGDKAKAVAGILAGGTSPAARVLGARLLIDEAAAAGRPPPKRGAKPPPDELLDLIGEGEAE
jgi:6-phosphogluconolactonase